jgi:hypothetical protein
VSQLEALFILAVFLILIALIWLAFRKARLWYWKTDIQIDALKNIENQLKKVDERLSQGIDLEHEVSAAGAEASIQGTDSLKENSGQESLFIEEESAIGRSGKVYKESELEVQIKE